MVGGGIRLQLDRALQLAHSLCRGSGRKASVENADQKPFGAPERSHLVLPLPQDVMGVGVIRVGRERLLRVVLHQPGVFDLFPGVAVDPQFPIGHRHGKERHRVVGLELRRAPRALERGRHPAPVFIPIRVGERGVGIGLGDLQEDRRIVRMLGVGLKVKLQRAARIEPSVRRLARPDQGRPSRRVGCRRFGAHARGRRQQPGRRRESPSRRCHRSGHHP